MRRLTVVIPGLVAATLVWLAALTPALGQSRRDEQDPPRQDVIKLDTALVTVPVIVTDRYSRLVTGLMRNDFQLREEGVPQEITSFSSTEAPFNVALLIDTSRSTRNKLGDIRKAALNFIKQLKPQDRVLIVTFDERVHFLGDFTSDRGLLARTIRSVKSSYLTSLYDAIHLTIREKLVPLEGRKAIVVLSDGVDTYSRQATFESSLELVSDTGVVSYAVQYETRNDGGSLMRPAYVPPSSFGFAPTPFVAGWQGRAQAERDRYLIATNYLNTLATRSGARYIRAESIENTSYAFSLIADELRHQYTLSYYSSNERRDGGYRAIAVSVDRADLSVRSRQGYRVPKAEGADGQEPAKRPAGESKP